MMTRLISPVIALSFFCGVLNAFEIHPDGGKYLYKCGEKAVFRLTPVKDEKMPEKVVVCLRGGAEKTKVLNLKAKDGKFPEITATLNKPGFVYIETVGGKKKVSAGAGFEPEKIRAIRPRPATFDAYWDKARNTLDKLPLKYEKVELKSGVRKGFKSYELKITTDDPANPLYAVLTIPVGAKPKSLAAYLLYHGAGTDRIYPVYRRDAVTLSVNPMSVYHKGPQSSTIRPKDARFYRYHQWGADDLQKNYFPGMFKRVYRSLQFMKSQPEWDQRTLIVRGGSQGGAQALVAAGLDKDVTLCIAGVPALCDHGGFKGNGESGWPRYNTRPEFRKNQTKAAAALDMIDVVFFAGNIRNAKVVVTTGFIDRTCVSSSVYAAYNNIPAKDKQIFNDFRSGHSVPRETNHKIDAIVVNHIKAKKQNSR